MDLVDFLRARLDEDERAALAVEIPSGMSWFEWAHHHGFALMNVARHGPLRVLADVEAKRLLIDLAFDHAATLDGEWGCCHTAEQIRRGLCEYERPNKQPLLRLLALPYADHPDFDEAWRV